MLADDLDDYEIGKSAEDPSRFQPKARPPEGLSQLQATCPPTSALRKVDFGQAPMNATGLELPEPPLGAATSFIGAIRPYLDLCANPQYRHFQSSVSFGHAYGPSPLLPLFTPGVHGNFPDIHSVLLDGLDTQYAYQAEHVSNQARGWPDRPEVARAIKLGRIEPDPADSDDVAWADKPFDRVAWRGQNSGLFWSKHTPWRATGVRARMHLLSKQTDGSRALLVADERGVARATLPWPNKILNPAYFDTGITGPPVQCADDPDDRTCDELYDGALRAVQAGLILQSSTTLIDA